MILFRDNSRARRSALSRSKFARKASSGLLARNKRLLRVLAGLLFLCLTLFLRGPWLLVGFVVHDRQRFMTLNVPDPGTIPGIMKLTDFREISMDRVRRQIT